jgi:dolichol-phosphate mannosyltransferase
VVVGHLSVVIPAYNEAEAIGPLLAELDREVTSRFETAETIVLDDASTDATPEVLAELARSSPALRAERADENRGHGPSVRAGLELARGEWIFQLDSDRQTAPKDFWLLWERRDDADLILGVRLHRRDPKHRLVLTTIVRSIVSLLVGRAVRDPNVPFRLVRRPLWQDLRAFVGERPLIPSILVTTGAVVRGWRVVEVPIAHRPRETGSSSLRGLRLARFSVRALVELVAFRLRLARAGPR